MGGIVTNLSSPQPGVGVIGDNNIITSTEKKESDNNGIHLNLSQNEIKLIRQSWSKIKEEGVNTIGEELFIRFFAKHPETLLMFDEFSNNPDWKTTKEFKGHCRIVMNFIRGCVQSLEKEDHLAGTLEYLGFKHYGLGITEEHFLVLGEILLDLLKEHLQVSGLWNHNLEIAWGKVYDFMREMMLKRMNMNLEL